MVILLVTGPMCAGKDIFVNILKEHLNYKVNKVTKCTVENLWDFKTHKPITSNKEAILKETDELIKLSLKEWESDSIIYPIYYPESVEEITKKRSYFKIVGIVSPIENRLATFVQRHPELKETSEDEFIQLDDYLNFEVGITECLTKAEFQISNIGGENDLLKKIADHDLILMKIFRPNWDVYFMQLAHVVRERSNCMKRSVGAIIVQKNRIVSTGYNGTPGRLTNCYEGGCTRCNDNKNQGVDLDKCNCIHAEENSVLECGVHKAKGATVYTTLAPCRWCTKILIQAEVARVVYDEDYSMEGSNELFKAAGIVVDCVSINL